MTYTLILHYPETTPYLGCGEWGDPTESRVEEILNLTVEKLQERLAEFYSEVDQPYGNFFVFESAPLELWDLGDSEGQFSDDVISRSKEIKNQRVEMIRKEAEEKEKMRKLLQAQELEREERNLLRSLKLKYGENP